MSTSLDTNKVSYSRWLYYVSMIHQVHEMVGSWTEVSRQLGKDPGFAKQSTSHRSIVGEEDIAALESIVAPRKRKGKGIQKGAKVGTRLSGSQRAEYSKLLAELCARGWSDRQIGNAIGLSTAMINVGRNKGGGTVEKLTELRHLFDRITKAERTVVPDGNGPLETEDTVPLTADEYVQIAKHQAAGLLEALVGLKMKLPAVARHAVNDVIEMTKVITRRLVEQAEDGTEG